MTDRNQNKRGLGRGLSALLQDVGMDSEDIKETRSAEKYVPIENIEPNPDQPRRDFHEADLEELTESIRQKGVIQPLIVRAHPTKHGYYEIVAGERRWRASQRAQLHKLPVVIRDLDDTEVLELAIIENIQRSDLNPAEEAYGYQQLMDKFGHTQEQLATALGKSRSHIANLLRLLNLPQEVLQKLRDRELSAGHARALVGHPDAVVLSRKIISGGLSVRQTEALLKKEKSEAGVSKSKKPHHEKDSDTVALEADLSAAIGMRVLIEHGSQGSGELRIKYKNLDDLDKLCHKIMGY